MARTYSLMIDLGSSAPEFELPVANPDTASNGGESVSLADFEDAEGLVVVFTCNHCPYAVHVENTLIRLAREFEDRGIRFVAISSNDPALYPDDSFDAMAARADEKAYPYPYLFDATQDVAKAYGAVCTPDPFVFDRDRRLVYRGRVDATRPGMGESRGEDLRAALEALLQRQPPLKEQFPSMGCNIKWTPGREPARAAGAVPADTQ